MPRRRRKGKGWWAPGTGFKKSDRAKVSLVEDHNSASFLSSNANEAQDRTQDPWAITTSAVGLFSTTRRKRYHQDEMIRRACCGGTSPRSSATRPKPLLCKSRSVALNACSMLAAQRTQSNRSKSTPASAADEGSSTSFVSTRAHTSWCVVARTRAESIKLVRPEDAGPKISVIAPRGSPPVTASTSATPVESTSAAAFSRSLNVEPKRVASSDSIAAFEIASLKIL